MTDTLLSQCRAEVERAMEAEPSAEALDAAYAVSERQDGDFRTEPLMRALRAAYAIDQQRLAARLARMLAAACTYWGDADARLRAVARAREATDG